MSENVKQQYQYAFLDSGSGGLPYLAQLQFHSPHASCVYLADTKHFPYGEKNREEVIQYASQAVSLLLDRFSPQVIIIACNTMSVAALEHLRSRFSVPFVGTVPAIKLAASSSKNRKIGLLATERTVSDPYTDDLIARFASDCEIIRIGDSPLIARIESDLVTASYEERLAAVKPSIERFRAACVDTIVLACTHFLHVRDEIHEIAGSDITIIDSREGVVHQALHLAPPVSQKSENTSGNTSICYITGGVSSAMESRYRTYSGLFGITWGGIL